MVILVYLDYKEFHAFQGPFYLYGLMLIVSVIVFVIEKNIIPQKEDRPSSENERGPELPMKTEDKVSKEEEPTLQVVEVEVEVVQHQRLDVEVLADIEASV